MGLVWTHDLDHAAAVWELVDDLGRGDDASPFAHPAFLLAWLRTVEGRPHFGIVSDDGEVLGILAMEQRAGEPDALRLWGDGFDFATFHCRPDAEAACAAAWLDGIEAVADRVLLRNCLVGDRVVAALLAQARDRGLRVDCLDRRLAPFVDLTGWPSGWAAGRTRSQRRQVRRSSGRFARIPGLQLTVVDRPEDIGPCIDRFAEMHVASFAVRGRRSLYEQRGAVEFLRALAVELGADGRFHALEAYDGEGLGAVELIVTSSRTWYSFNSAWRADLAAHHPGTGILLHALDSAAAAGVTRYSLLEGEEHYKSRFATGGDRLETWRVRT